MHRSAEYRGADVIETPIVPKPHPALFGRPSTERPLSAELPPIRSTLTGFRDPDFVDVERTLDTTIDQFSPALAVPIETSLLQEVHSRNRVSEGLGRTTLKAIGIAQVARQMELAPRPEVDTSYQELGTLLDKLYNERLWLAANSDSFHEERVMINGLRSEIAFYMLAAYNASLSEPLTKHTANQDDGAESTGARFILPSTIAQDNGYYKYKNDDRKVGYDFKVTHQYGEDPDRYIQVKTRTNPEEAKLYVPEIRTIALESLVAYRAGQHWDLVDALANDARNEATNKDNYRIHVASRRLSKVLQ